MLDPFVQAHTTDDINRPALNEEDFAQFYGHSLDTSTPRPSVGLWFGRLLIRMGARISGERVTLNSSKESA